MKNSSIVYRAAESEFFLWEFCECYLVYLELNLSKLTVKHVF